MKTRDNNSPGRSKNRARYILNVNKVSQLHEIDREALAKVSQRYAFRVTDYYLGLIDWMDPNDPLRRLVIPNVAEMNEWGELDASAEGKVTVQRGVQHKYGSTVLLLVTEVCAAFCRYCFRKRLFMNDNDEAVYDVGPGLQYIREHPEVNNVLLTGGDPLILQTPKLERILAKLREIDHVRIIRIGSKMTAFNPYRVLNDDSLVEALRKYSQPDRRIYMMCHFDHPRELTAQAREAVARLIDAGVICVNQNPIMRGISDDPDIMAELWNELSYMGVPQYYVFQGRPTAGNSPYELPIVEAHRRIEQAKKKCSGLAKRPRFTMSHESGKIEIVGVDERHIYLKYHRAKHRKDEQRLVVCHRDDEAYWLDQLRPVKGHINEYYNEYRTVAYN